MERETHNAHTKVGFVGMNDVLVPYASYIAEQGNAIVVWNGHQFSRMAKSVVQKHKEYGFFGIGPFIRKRFADISLPFYFHGLKADIRAEKPDILIVMDFIRLWFWQALSAKKKNPSMHLFLYAESKRDPSSTISRLLYPFFRNALVRNVDLIERVLVYTPEGKSYLSQFIPAQKITVIPVPVDEALFYPDIEKNWLPEGTLRILMNARFSAYKHHADLLYAIASIEAEERSQVCVSFIGNDSGQRHEIESLVAKLSLGRNVRFLNRVPLEEMREVYRAHDVLVLPSYNEAIGMAVPEAMACGLPTITSDTVGANVYVQEGGTGFVFPTGDQAALAVCIRDMRAPDQARTMGAVAAVRMQEHFSSQALKKHFGEVIGI